MGRFDLVRGVLFLFLLLPVTAPGFAYFPFNSDSAVTGSVYSAGTNRPLALVTVVLCDDAGNPLQQSSTNDGGEFAFRGLRPGHYILKVMAPGFETVELHADLSFASEQGLSILLKPEPKSTPALSPGGTISAHELAMPEEARNVLAAGKKKLYVEKDAQAALSDFQSATSRAPGYYEAYYQAGMAYLSLQIPAEAEEQFRKSVELSGKKYADADIALAALLLQRNQMDEGESLLRLGLQSNPLSWPGQFELGKLELSRNQVGPALTAAEKAKELAPRESEVYRLLAVIHLRQRNFSALIDDLDCYIQLDPDSPAGARAKELRAEAQRQLAAAPDSGVTVNK